MSRHDPTLLTACLRENHDCRGQRHCGEKGARPNSSANPDRLADTAPQPISVLVRVNNAAGFGDFVDFVEVLKVRHDRCTVGTIEGPLTIGTFGYGASGRSVLALS